MAHVGPPAANVEVKLMADSDAEVDQNLQDPVGKVRRLSDSGLGANHCLA